MDRILNASVQDLGQFDTLEEKHDHRDRRGVFASDVETYQQELAANEPAAAADNRQLAFGLCTCFWAEQTAGEIFPDRIPF